MLLRHSGYATILAAILMMMVNDTIGIVMVTNSRNIESRAANMPLHSQREDSGDEDMSHISLAFTFTGARR